MTPTGEHAPLFARLEVIADEPPFAAALNMAADEALLAGLTDYPVLRIYRWRRAAVSFGYFDAVAPVRRAYPGHELVRRWTGGGVVEHGRDFTYSLLVPRTHALTALRAEESYSLLHARVALAIAAADPGLPSVEEHHPGAGPTDSTSRACFVNAVRHDLMLAGQKIAGAAQRRTRRGWLHQGSIQFPGETSGLYERLRHTLPAVLSMEILPRGLRPEEHAAACELVRSKYGTDAWTQRF